jgi:hypothetical protein
MAVACGGPQTPAPSVHEKPKLVVLLVIDQLPTWAFDRDRDLFKGGLARMLKEGGYVRAGELPYANAFTAPGHATIGTGQPPAASGIIGNTWYRRSENKELAADWDPKSPIFSVDGSGPIDLTASAAALRVDGISEALRAAHPGAHSAAIGLKARGALFVAGKRPDVAVFFEAKAGGMTTSAAYAKELPPWLAQLAKDKPAKRFVGVPWNPMDGGLLRRERRFADASKGEGDMHGIGPAFPHIADDLDHISATPFGDTVVLEAANAALAALPLGTDDTPDLLAVSLNAHDYVGHIFGPDSWEILDQTMQLDRALGTWFEQLDQRFGADGWVAVLTSDHGATPLVERSQIKGARRIPPAEITQAINGALEPLLGEGTWVDKLAENQIYLSNAINDPVLREKAIAIAMDTVKKVPNVESVYRVDQTMGHCETRTGMEQAVCNGLAPDISGELYIVPARGSLISEYRAGTHHDSPNSDNREVPIIVRAPGLAGKRLDHASTLQIAPTVTALLGVPAPNGATAAPLFDLPAAKR